MRSGAAADVHRGRSPGGPRSASAPRRSPGGRCRASAQACAVAPRRRGAPPSAGRGRPPGSSARRRSHAGSGHTCARDRTARSVAGRDHQEAGRASCAGLTWPTIPSAWHKRGRGVVANVGVARRSPRGSPLVLEQIEDQRSAQPLLEDDRVAGVGPRAACCGTAWERSATDASLARTASARGGQGQVRGASLRRHHCAVADQDLSVAVEDMSTRRLDPDLANPLSSASAR